MKLADALKPLARIQALFLISLVTLGKKGPKVSRLHLFCSYCCIPATLTSWLLLGLLTSRDFDVFVEQHPVEKSQFNALLTFIPLIVTFFGISVIWIKSLTLRTLDLQFYELLQSLDETIGKFRSTSDSNRRLRKMGLRRVAGFVVAFANIALFSAIMPRPESWALSVLMLSLNMVAMICMFQTVVFGFYVLVICEKSNLILEIAPKVSAAEDFLVLVRAEKIITKLVDNMNASMCVKQAFVILSNWTGQTALSYNIFTSMVFWNEHSGEVIMIYVSLMIPHSVMLAISSHYGSKLEASVRACRMGLSGTRMPCDFGRALQRKMCLKRLTLTSQLRIFGIPLSLHTLFVVSEFALPNIVILFQFKQLASP